ncbi:MAG TPA: PatB family C-S lyase [Candidatus Competibacteraceae bacterium]|nr:PatB family C-S lyase [Candidatus Competibacteraceae bacterium]
MQSAARFDFDRLIDRRCSDSDKWLRYPADVLPMWVADMDFPCPPALLEHLQAVLEQGVLGYGVARPAALLELLCERLWRLYRWRVQPDEVLLLPGLVCGLNLVSRAIGQPGDEVLIQTPVYPPFMSAPRNQERTPRCVPLHASWRNGHLHYAPDLDALAAAIGPRTRLFLLCQPHNPVGRVFDAGELTALAELCARHDLVICSDEVHGELLLGDSRHQPLAALSPEIARRTVTLLAPSKTFNIAGLGASFAIVPDAELRRRLERTAAGIVPQVNLLAVAAAEAAYRYGDEWLAELRRYLTANCDFLLGYLAEHLPLLGCTRPEATYLAWIDCRQAGIAGNPQRFFLERGKIALNDGATFGPGGEGFVRLNFGCPRVLLEQGLERMRTALATR